MPYRENPDEIFGDSPIHLLETEILLIISHGIPRHVLDALRELGKSKESMRAWHYLRRVHGDELHDVMALAALNLMPAIMNAVARHIKHA